MKRSGKNESSSRSFRFNATLERMRSRLNWIIVRIPYDAAKLFGVRGQIKVRGSINGFPFRSALFPTGDGRHILLVNKKMQSGARARAGDVAVFKIEPDLEERPMSVPAPFQKILVQNKAFRRWYDGLIPSTRREIGKWLNEPKSDDSRKRRSEQVAERLLETMEAEVGLPPLLANAFARNPEARKGWELMSLARRRSHLLAIFYFRSPESRANRTNKMLEDAVAIAARKGEV